MKLPRALSGAALAKTLEVLGYRIVRQSGRHMGLTTTEHAEHHLPVPNHDLLRVGSLQSLVTSRRTSQ